MCCSIFGVTPLSGLQWLGASGLETWTVASCTRLDGSGTGRSRVYWIWWNRERFPRVKTQVTHHLNLVVWVMKLPESGLREQLHCSTQFTFWMVD